MVHPTCVVGSLRINANPTDENTFQRIFWQLTGGLNDPVEKDYFYRCSKTTRDAQTSGAGCLKPLLSRLAHSDPQNALKRSDLGTKGGHTRVKNSTIFSETR